MIILTNHVNYPDENSKIYCRFSNSLITLDYSGKFWDKCLKCPLFSGDYQGMGVECSWEDSNELIVYINNPTKELLRVSKEIDKGNMKSYKTKN